MNDFGDFDIEIQDNKNSSLESFIGSIATAGVPSTLTPTSRNSIRLAFINVQSKRDPDNPNDINDAIKYSIDGGITYHTLLSGESIFIPGVFTNLKLDTNNNGTYYQVILWS